jgi:hypothetical protein
MVVLCLAGGASRPDVLGQSVVRAAAALALVTTFLLAQRPEDQIPRIVPALLAAIVALPLLQLLPLPPSVWQALPGRAVFQQAVTGAQPWRPMSIEPGATVNAAGSLLIPVAVLVLAAGVRRSEWERVILLVLAIAGISAVVALMQVSGSPVSDPLVNYTSWRWGV